MNIKKATTDHHILKLLAERWSPCCFEDRPVSDSDLRSLFEAARWAASSYNEQPWNYLVATRDNSLEFDRLLSCLVETNQTWAKTAPVLVLSVVSLKFTKNKQDNQAAVHDLGLAAGNLVVEATSRGLSVHQMIGILPDKVRELYRIPEHFAARTAMAIGYKDDPATLLDALKERDQTPRQRKPLVKFVFTSQWGQPSPLVLKRDT
ncbi:MAG: nitroreductase family protein [Verrucomicrobiota bacterium]|nr:nitroreductase family protein [Verrucomicrobiota bacterium]